MNFEIALKMGSKSKHGTFFSYQDWGSPIRRKNSPSTYILISNTIKSQSILISNVCVELVITDAMDHFSYENMNWAFQLLMRPEVGFLAAAQNRYYSSGGKLQLDMGGYVKCLVISIHS